MADSTRIPGEHVKCHECPNIWPRQQGGLQCPRCESEFVEIVESVSESNLPSPDDLPPLIETADDSDDRHLPRSRSSDFLEQHNPWRNFPDPDEDDIGELDFGTAPTPPRGYHWESRSPNGSSSFSFSMFSSNGGPMIITNNRSRGAGGQPGDPAMAEAGRDRGTRRPDSPLPPGFGFGPPGQPPPHTQFGGPLMGLFSTLLQGLGGGRGEGGADGNLGPFAILQRMMDPANAAQGDAVFSQEALDRVITQLMEQNQGSNAPGPASEAAIRSLPKKTVENDMLDDRGKAECSICMDAVELGDQVTVLPCKHWFHEICITAWLKEHDTCPHCRKGISTPPEANGHASRGGSGQTNRPPRRRSSAAMPGGWQENTGTSPNPVVVEETSPGPQDIRAARERYYSSQQPEDLERHDTHGERRSSRATPSSSNDRRHRSRSHRSSSYNNNNSGGGGFGGWVRSFGSSGGGR
ncbi:hypothetical protein GJ744_003188 [Endocarpon pusillum]|uniref:RING-type E3 ubiquitin transferase n=1 Tax=Endocarpon pusillum TaxID=364733 RepID=A0A8H7AVM2_9EURO|nr:hypothetical protein GJ744_003188 [Endocarpon pusillum]